MNWTSIMGRSKDLYEKQFEFYNSLKTYKDICSYGYLFVSNKVSYFPGWIPSFDGDRANCYENGDNIHYYLKEFNLYGFRTHCSQPSRRFTKNVDKKCECFDRELTGFTKNDISITCRVQKASVNGCINTGIGKCIFEELKDDERIYIHICPNTNVKIKPFPCMSYYHNKETNEYRQTSAGPDAICGPLHTGFADNFIKNKNVDTMSLSWCRIGDKTSNNDEYMWKKVLEALKKYSKRIELPFNEE